MENISQNSQKSGSENGRVDSMLDINKRVARDAERYRQKGNNAQENMSKSDIEAHLKSSKDFMTPSKSGVNISKDEATLLRKESSEFMHSSSRNDLANRKMSAASVNSDIGRMEIAKETEEKRKNTENDQNGAQNSSRNQVAQAYQKRKEAILKAAKAKIESRKENRSDLNAMGFIIIFIAFVIAVFSDLLDVVVDGTGIGAFLAPVSSVLTGPIVGFLWWSLGVGDANSKLKKSAKRLLGACGIEAIPLIDILPAMTVLCVINLLDYFGYLDFKDWGKTYDKNRTEDALS